MSANSKDFKIHIADSSFKRKMKFARKNKVKAIILAIVISDTGVEVYQSRLRQSVRIGQMRRLK